MTRRRRGAALPLLPLAAGLLLGGCGRPYVVLDPAGPVGRTESHLILVAAVAMGMVAVPVCALFAIAVVRFRDVPGRRARYTPNWSHNRALELLWFAVPTLIVTWIAVPTVSDTFGLAKLPPARSALIVDVTSLSWKWLFQYPQQRIATVNYAVIPTGRPVLFEITADSPMNAFWVPQLGGMENAVPGRVLPLWLQADRAGTYQGRSAQFSGVDFERMSFDVRALAPPRFTAWTDAVGRTAAPMTLADYHRLLRFGTVPPATYAGYPAGTFPATKHGFTLVGGFYEAAGQTAGVRPRAG